MTEDPQTPPRAAGRPGLLAREWPILIALTGVLLGLAVAAGFDRFRRGALIIGMTVVLGAWLRALLPEERVGVLRVRRRAVDVVTLGGLGVGIVVLALAVPPPS